MLITKRAEPGSSAVRGTSSDYSKIINFIKNNSIDEVHVSLDIHNERHIGYPAFWYRLSADDTDGLTILSINGENIITGFHIIRKTTTQYIPRILVDDFLCNFIPSFKL
jgi:hypothetical protein